MSAVIEEPALGKANILVVDDLAEKLLVFHSILDELGQNLVMARSGSEALEQVLQREFAVILLDVNMPDIDGMETAALIRRYKRSAHTPIIFITAHADEMQTAQGYQLGAVDYILSPIIADVLRSKVRVFVDLYQMRERTRLMAEERVALERAAAARRAAEETTRRSNFLARASRELGASLDVEEGMRRLVALVVPQIAELAAVLLQAAESPASQVVRSLYDGEAADTRPSAPFAEVPAACADAMRQALALGQPVRTQGALAIPLRTGERLIGVLLLATLAEAEPFGERDASMLQELASRAAMALDNAMLYRNLQREIERSRRAEESLQEAGRRKDEFLAMLSHELRNPLAPIRSAVEVMHRAAPAEGALAMARDVVDRQVAHLVRLVDELLDVSRISQGKIVLTKEPVELAEVVRHGIETERGLIESRRQRLVVELPAAPVWLFGDFVRLAQVLSNLLNNATKYTQENGLIEILAGANEGEATIRVRDNGAGIEPRLLSQVFDLFVQGERSLDRAQGGLGVGLTVVRRIVELHEGRVEVLSAGVGAGTEVRIVLPCVSAVPAPGSPSAAPAAALTPAGQRRSRVLVADDNADAAESMAACLRLAGHEVRTALNGEQALEVARVFQPEAIVLDVGMPGLDGYEVARRLRSREDTRDALLIALTGYGQQEDRQRARAAGFDEHFVKPADVSDIEAAIGRGRPLRAELKAS